MIVYINDPLLMLNGNTIENNQYRNAAFPHIVRHKLMMWPDCLTQSSLLRDDVATGRDVYHHGVYTGGGWEERNALIWSQHNTPDE